MTGPGIGHHLRVADIGGMGNTFPVIKKEKFYDLKEIIQECELPNAFVFGPGGGPWHVVGHECEVVADANFSFDPPKVKMHTGVLKDNHKPYAKVIDVPQLGLNGNLAMSDGAPGLDVLKIYAKTRIDDKNFPDAIRSILSETYPGQLVSMCGVFLLKTGVISVHIPSDFPPDRRTWHDKKEKDEDWPKFFEVKAPLVCTSIFHSMDPGLNLMMQHTHCYGERDDIGGHYHEDTTPEIVEYEGYFGIAEAVYRIDQTNNNV